MISNINSVDELLESLRDYLDDTNYESEFNLDNIINYYNIDDFDELDDRFIASDEMDSKIELIDTFIKLVLTNELIEPCGAFDSDEFADDEE